MKTFDPNIVLELAKEGFSFFLYTELSFSSTYRYQNSDIDIYYDSNLYTPIDFTIGGIETSGDLGVDSIEIEFNDVEGVLKAIVLNEDIRGKSIEVGFFCLNASAVVIELQSMFLGIVNDWELKEGTCKIEIQNELVLWRKETLRQQSSSCQWVFKGTECTYSGNETWCDQSYERCEALGNEDNYGGFRWLPSIMDVDIWWGRVPDRSSE